MKRSLLVFCSLFAAAALAQAASVIYPAHGQSAKQQDKDRYECHDWARAQSGYDPTQAASAQAASSAQPGSSSINGADMLKGAMGGAAVGELASHDAGRGAAVGVLGAAARSRARDAQAAQAAQQQAAQKQQQRAQLALNYDKAMAACMEGRGYVVK